LVSFFFGSRVDFFKGKAHEQPLNKRPSLSEFLQNHKASKNASPAIPILSPGHILSSTILY
jgi:hypothetical protein